MLLIDNYTENLCNVIHNEYRQGEKLSNESLNIDDNNLNDTSTTVNNSVVNTINVSKVEQYLGQKSVLEIVFGGAKRFIIIAMTLAILASYFSGVEIPERIVNLCLGIIGLYFGVGAMAVSSKIAK